MRGRRLAEVLALAALLVALTLLSLKARSAPTTTGFALDRFRPAEAGSDWLAGESLDLRGSLRPALSLVADISYRPLVLYDANGEELVPQIDGQFYYHFGASWVLGSRLRIAASVPLLVYSQGGEGLLAQLGDPGEVRPARR